MLPLLAFAVALQQHMPPIQLVTLCSVCRLCNKLAEVQGVIDLVFRNLLPLRPRRATVWPTAAWQARCCRQKNPGKFMGDFSCKNCAPWAITPNPQHHLFVTAPASIAAASGDHDQSENYSRRASDTTLRIHPKLTKKHIIN